MRCLMWFREHDLRCHDNTALYNASQLASDGLIAIFLISPMDWQAHNMAACRVDFLLRNLRCLSDALAKLNIPLLIQKVDDPKLIPKILLKIAQEQHIDKLFFNEQFEVDEKKRDAAVQTIFTANKITCHSYIDQVVLAPGETLTQAGKFFTVFTPFKKAWIKQCIAKNSITTLSLPKKQKPLSLSANPIPEKISSFTSSVDPTLWPAGENEAQNRLQDFIRHRIKDYQHNRDFPDLNGTSQLSPYLTSGIISPRQCIHAALAENNGKFDAGNIGITTWISELIWREFYKHILFAFPRVCKNRAFQLKTENIPWQNHPDHFHAWQQGKTGIPIVDAAMRQLQHMGWMHNRLRMITAMFLSKNLLIDWRWGEKFFMQHLIDGDFSANNGGWQWSASTGTDAAPYFRIFNPISQSQRFDPEGNFIKKYCPELASYNAKTIHDAGKPIVDLSATRKQAIAVFKAIN